MAEAISPSSSRSTTPPPSENMNIATEADRMSDKEKATENTNSSVQAKLLDIESGEDQGTSSSGSASGGTKLESAIDKLLQKQRNELMFELRRIEHGDRPVTGQGNKEAVEQFFTRDRTEPAEQSRPDSVVVEVNALVERRPVSSLLQGSGFRRSLENALRGAIGRGSSSRSIFQGQARSASPAVPPPVTPSVNVESGEAVRQRNVATAQAQRRETQEQAIRRRQETSNTTSATQQRRVQNVQVTRSVDEGNVQLPNQRQSSVTAAQAWLQQTHQPQSHHGQDNLWGRIEEVHREEMIMEISELVQRQLVTETLHGNFRNVLERRMNERLDQSDSDGRRVQQFVRSIPQSSVHMRNDFTDLGIHMADPVGENQSLSDHLDEMSVVSATAAVTMPYAQSNLAMNRELQSLKTQMREMMNMMKLNFDLTMDVQRSVRQEVAAAMDTRNGTASASGLSSRPTNEDQCLICLDKDVDTVLYQCGHMCVCYTCGMNLRQRGSNCPVCRAPIKDIIRAYRCNPKDQA